MFLENVGKFHMQTDDEAQRPPRTYRNLFENTLQCHSLTCVILEAIGLLCGLVYRIKLNVKNGICVRNRAWYRCHTVRGHASTHNNHQNNTARA